LLLKALILDMLAAGADCRFSSHYLPTAVRERAHVPEPSALFPYSPTPNAMSLSAVRKSCRMPGWYCCGLLRDKTELTVGFVAGAGHPAASSTGVVIVAVRREWPATSEAPIG
jgi:hypothetical protein